MNNPASGEARRIVAIRPRALSGGTLSNRIAGWKTKHHPFLPRCPSTLIFSSATRRSTKAESPRTPLSLHRLSIAPTESGESVSVFCGRVRLGFLPMFRVDCLACVVMTMNVHMHCLGRQIKIAQIEKRHLRCNCSASTTPALHTCPCQSQQPAPPRREQRLKRPLLPKTDSVKRYLSRCAPTFWNGRQPTSRTRDSAMSQPSSNRGSLNMRG